MQAFVQLLAVFYDVAELGFSIKLNGIFWLAFSGFLSFNKMALPNRKKIEMPVLLEELPAKVAGAGVCLLPKLDRTKARES